MSSTIVSLADPKNKIQQSDKVIVKQSIMSQNRLGENESPTLFFLTLSLIEQLWAALKPLTETAFKDTVIGSKESIPPAYVAWRAGTTALFLFGS